MECVNCKRALGAEAKVLPFFVDDCATETSDRAKREAWCPRCFAYKRALMEPARFWPGTFVPIVCCSCHVESVDHAHKQCLQCGSRSILALAPDPEVGLGDTGGRTKLMLGAVQRTAS